MSFSNHLFAAVLLVPLTLVGAEAKDKTGNGGFVKVTRQFDQGPILSSNVLEFEEAQQHYRDLYKKFVWLKRGESPEARIETLAKKLHAYDPMFQSAPADAEKIVDFIRELRRNRPAPGQGFSAPVQTKYFLTTDMLPQSEDIIKLNFTAGSRPEQWIYRYLSPNQNQSEFLVQKEITEWALAQSDEILDKQLMGIGNHEVIYKGFLETYYLKGNWVHPIRKDNSFDSDDARYFHILLMTEDPNRLNLPKYAALKSMMQKNYQYLSSTLPFQGYVVDIHSVDGNTVMATNRVGDLYKLHFEPGSDQFHAEHVKYADVQLLVIGNTSRPRGNFLIQVFINGKISSGGLGCNEKITHESHALYTCSLPLETKPGTYAVTLLPIVPRRSLTFSNVQATVSNSFNGESETIFLGSDNYTSSNSKTVSFTLSIAEDGKMSLSK